MNKIEAKPPVEAIAGPIGEKLGGFFSSIKSLFTEKVVEVGSKPLEVGSLLETLQRVPKLEYFGENCVLGQDKEGCLKFVASVVLSEEPEAGLLGGFELRMVGEMAKIPPKLGFQGIKYEEFMKDGDAQDDPTIFKRLSVVVDGKIEEFLV